MHRLRRAFLVIALIALTVRSRFALALAVAVGVLWGLGELITHRGAKNLQISRDVAGRAFTGDELTVRLRVVNRGVLPIPWVEVHDSAPLELSLAKVAQRFVLRIPARSERVLTYQLSCRRRGYYRLGPLTANVGDVFGHRLRQAPAVPVDHLIVYPKVLSMANPELPARAPVAAVPARASLHRDPARIRGVRDYQSGDSLRQIHWSASAAVGRLVVKQLDPTVARETMIVLDMVRRDFPRGTRRSAPEVAVTLAASLAAHILTVEQQPAGLAAHGRDPLVRSATDMWVPVAGDRDHLMVVLEHLARVQTTHEGDFPSFLDSAVSGLAWGSTVVVITGRVTPALRERIDRARTMGFKPALYVVGGSTVGSWRGVPVTSVRSEAEVGALP